VHGPPQSTSVSEPFFTPSVHVAAEQVPAAEQRNETQSPSHRHAASVPHPSQEPPQSWSLSVPFFDWSRQDGSVQRPALQIPERQSDPSEQMAFVEHGPHTTPPQSMSVSVPPLDASPHVAMRQMPDWHTFVVQSTSDRHG
jgi:hypothetical protein